MIEIDPYNPNDKGVVFRKECSNCELVDTGNTIAELEIAMANHICEVDDQSYTTLVLTDEQIALLIDTIEMEIERIEDLVVEKGCDFLEPDLYERKDLLQAVVKQGNN